MEQHDIEQVKEKSSSRRPIRNKRYNRRHFGEDKRPPKRLFTPEIKKFLKDWLIRRRENPYPNREEKKILAIQTGLTYIQVCNWFANWRRKLKNAGKEPQRKTWGHLIKTYNSQVHGNVEHFSICSEDSIWHEMEQEHLEDQLTPNSSSQSSPSGIQSPTNVHPYGKSYTYNSYINNNNNESIQAQCFLISSTTPEEINLNPFFKHQQQQHQLTNKYKNHIMEKYLRDCQKPLNQFATQTIMAADLPIEEDLSKPSMITKWLESAENFRPSEKNYLHWTLTNGDKRKIGTTQNCRKMNDLVLQNNYHQSHMLNPQHGREELDAAEALTRLANAHATVKIT